MVDGKEEEHSDNDYSFKKLDSRKHTRLPDRLKPQAKRRPWRVTAKDVNCPAAIAMISTSDNASTCEEQRGGGEGGDGRTGKQNFHV